MDIREVLPKCSRDCRISGANCSICECKHWIEYPEDFNCSLISIYKNGPMTLNEVSKRVGVSLVRISQIEKAALLKLKKQII